MHKSDFDIYHPQTTINFAQKLAQNLFLRGESQKLVSSQILHALCFFSKVSELLLKQNFLIFKIQQKKATLTLTVLEDSLQIYEKSYQETIIFANHLRTPVLSQIYKSSIEISKKFENYWLSKTDKIPRSHIYR